MIRIKTYFLSARRYISLFDGTKAIHKYIHGIFTKSQRVTVCAQNTYIILYKYNI